MLVSFFLVLTFPKRKLISFVYFEAKGTETVAIPFDSKTHKLYGYKWFSSANDANIALALARVSDDEGNVVQVYNIHDWLICLFD